MVFLAPLAQAAPAAPATPDSPPPGGLPPGLGIMLMLAVWAAIIYFVVYRPNKKFKQERKEMLENLKKNDEVVTTSGILGVITSVKDDEITLRVDEGTKIRFTREAIVGRVKEKEASQETAAK